MGILWSQYNEISGIEENRTIAFWFIIKCDIVFFVVRYSNFSKLTTVTYTAAFHSFYNILDIKELFMGFKPILVP